MTRTSARASARTPVQTKTRSKWTKAKVEELKRLHNAGHLQSEIADLLGVTCNCINGKIHRLGLKRNSYAASLARSRFRAGSISSSRSGSTSGSIKYSGSADMYYTEEDNGLISSGAKALMDLGSRECRYPINDAPVKLKKVHLKHLFCAKEVQPKGECVDPKGVYCDYHYKLCTKQEPVKAKGKGGSKVESKDRSGTKQVGVFKKNEGIN